MKLLTWDQITAIQIVVCITSCLFFFQHYQEEIPEGAKPCTGKIERELSYPVSF